MAKVSLTKLGLKVNQDVKNIEFNEQDIEENNICRLMKNQSLSHL